MRRACLTPCDMRVLRYVGLVVMLAAASCTRNAESREAVPVVPEYEDGVPTPGVVYVSNDGRTLRAGVGSCNGSPSAEVLESKTEVRLRVVSDTSFDGECLDNVTVMLKTPLGDRRVVDSFSDEALIPEPEPQASP